MEKKCRYCGFKNPADVGDCLACHKNLPITTGEFKERVEGWRKAAKGDWSGVVQKGVNDMVEEQVSSVKYRFHPVWILKLKLHHFKQSLISLLWVFGIIAAMVVIGLIYNFFAHLFK